MNGVRRLVFKILLVLALGAVVNVLLGVFLGDPAFWAQLRPRSLLLVGLGFIAYVVGMYLIETLRLGLILNAYQKTLGFWEQLQNSAMDYFFSSITPMAAGGQPLQILHLRSRGIPSSLAANIYINRYVQHLGFSILVVFLSLPFTINLIGQLQSRLGEGLLSGALLLSVILSLGLIYALLRPASLTSLFRFLGQRFDRLRRWSESVIEWLTSVQRSIALSWYHHVPLMLTDTLLGILNTLIQALSLWATLFFVGSRIDVQTTIVAYMILNLLVFYIPTPGASGGIEGIYSLAFGLLSGDFTASWSGIFLWRLGGFYLHIPFGFLILISTQRMRDFLSGASDNERTHSETTCAADLEP